jgi:capsid portal protein
MPENSDNTSPIPRRKTPKAPGVSSPSELQVQSSGMSAADFPFAGGSVMGQNLEGGAGRSRQVRPLEHGWQYVAPPYNFVELRGFYDQNSWNKASVDAIVDTTVGYEIKIKLAAYLKDKDDADDKQGDEAQKAVAVAFNRNAGDRYPLEDVIKACQQDYENTGNMYIEIARENGIPKYCYYIPADTMRIHFDRTKYEQIRGGKRAFFFPFSEDNRDFSLNEIIHIAKPNAISYYYGVPEHLAAIGAILGDLKSRDFNLDKFESNMIASWAMVFGGSVSPKTRRMVEDFFDQKLKKGDWHKPLIFGLDGSNLDVDKAFKFQKMSDDMRDMSFTLFRKLNRDEILAVRRCPPSRIAAFDNPRYQTSPEQSEQFRDEVVMPRQRRIEHAFNRIYRCLGVIDYEFDLPVADLTAETTSAQIATNMTQTQSVKRNEIRKVLKLDPLSAEDGGDEIVKPQAGAKPGEGGGGAPGGPLAGPSLSAQMSGLRPVAKSREDRQSDMVAGALERLERRLANIL